MSAPAYTSLVPLRNLNQTVARAGLTLRVCRAGGFLLVGPGWLAHSDDEVELLAALTDFLDRTKTEKDRKRPRPTLATTFFERHIMSLTNFSQSADAGTFELCPDESLPVRLVALYDVGTQPVTFEGVTTPTRQVELRFEVCDPETMRSDGRPFLLSRKFKLSLHPKAGLRRLLEAWRGKPYADSELSSVDFTKMLGVAGLATVVHATRGDRVYANLAGVTKLPRGMKVPEAITLMQLFDFAADDALAALEIVPKWTRELIERSPEYAALIRETAAPTHPPAPVPAARQAAPAPQAHPPAPTPPPQAPAGDAAGSGFDDMDDDIPF